MNGMEWVALCSGAVGLISIAVPAWQVTSHEPVPLSSSSHGAFSFAQSGRVSCDLSPGARGAWYTRVGHGEFAVAAGSSRSNHRERDGYGGGR